MCHLPYLPILYLPLTLSVCLSISLFISPLLPFFAPFFLSFFPPSLHQTFMLALPPCCRSPPPPSPTPAPPPKKPKVSPALLLYHLQGAVMITRSEYSCCTSDTSNATLILFPVVFMCMRLYASFSKNRILLDLIIELAEVCTYNVIHFANECP